MERADAPIAIPVVAPSPAVIMKAEGYLPTEAPIPQPLRERTLVVWSSQQCSACRNSGPTFRALENNREGWKVVHVEVNPEMLQRYPGHLLTLPTYDFLTPEPGAAAYTNPLGVEGARVRTVRINSPEALREVIPSLTLG
jgi:hypothetical protein